MGDDIGKVYVAKYSSIRYIHIVDEMIKLLTHFTECVALIVGEGEYKCRLEQFANVLNVNDRTFFLGAIPYNELLSITKQADIGFSLIQPISQSYEQALPNKLFEYGLAGLPTISSDFPELKKYTIDFNTYSESEYKYLFKNL